MTEAATSTVTLSPPLPLTTVENLFTVTHQLIYDYHRAISIFTGTSICSCFDIRLILLLNSL